MQTTSQPTKKAPTVQQTGLGYRFVRDRTNGDYRTCYVHQLCAIAGGADPHDVFSDVYDTHHVALSDWLGLDCEAPPTPLEVAGVQVPAVDTPESVALEPRWDHREQNLEEART